MTDDRHDAEDALGANRAHVNDALMRQRHVPDPVVLVMDLRFGRAERLARLISGDEEVEARKEQYRPEGATLVCVGPRREVAKAVRLVSPCVARRMAKVRIPPRSALVVTVADGGFLAQLVERPRDRSRKRARRRP
jgi:hypothetical protein